MQLRRSFAFTKLVTLFSEQILTDEFYWYSDEFADRHVSYVTSTLQSESCVATSALSLPPSQDTFPGHHRPRYSGQLFSRKAPVLVSA
jgi:hypothetical protein